MKSHTYKYWELKLQYVGQEGPWQPVNAMISVLGHCAIYILQNQNSYLAVTKHCNK